jgi:tripartite-type tricarboxylate transporter receptor subunit TctC
MPHTYNRRAAASRMVLAGLAAAVPALTRAQTYPNKPLRLVVPFTPGGSTDVLGRAIGNEIGRSLGQPVVIENVPGAGGSLGAERVAKSPADGYTLLMGHIGTLAVNPSLYPKLGYDPLKNFTPVAWVARVPNVLVVHPSVPAQNFKELIAYAKSHPGQLAYGSGGNGSAAHIAMEFLKLQTGTSFLHIPYRGTAPSVTDLIAGQVQVLFTGLPALLPQIKAGKMRALAVSSPKRLALLPDVPTFSELGYPQLEAVAWMGLWCKTDVPAALQLRGLLASETKRWSEVIVAAKVPRQ